MLTLRLLQNRCSWLHTAFSNSCIQTNRRSWDYYRRHLKQNFVNHDDEVDPERLEQIFQTARSDADYLIEKVGREVDPPQPAKGFLQPSWERFDQG